MFKQATCLYAYLRYQFLQLTCYTFGSWQITVFYMQAMEDWDAKEAERQAALASVRGGLEDASSAGDVSAMQFVAYVPLPDQKEIEAKVLESKKQALLSKYASESLVKEQQEAKALLNRR